MNQQERSAPESNLLPLEGAIDGAAEETLAAELDRLVLSHLADKLRNVVQQRS